MSIPLSRPPIDDEIKGAILKAVDSRQYILGPECRAFEDVFAVYNGAKDAVLTASATAALWMLVMAFGAGPGDEILVPSHTAFPPVEAICFAGATPVFVDVDDSFTVDVRDAATQITPRTVGFVPVHLYGHPADLPAIQALCAERGLWLLEDCAQAHGAEWQGRKVGGFGRAAAFSFYPSKNLTVMGDGGLLVTNDDAVAARCRQLRDHGRLNKDVHAEVGFNLRFNDIQAAVGRVLLRRLDAMNEQRHRVAARYARGLAGLPVRLPSERAGARHVYHLYVIRTSHRERLQKHLSDSGVITLVHYPRPVHLQPAYRERVAIAPGGLPITEQVCDEILSLPMHPDLSDEDVAEVCEALLGFEG